MIRFFLLFYIFLIPFESSYAQMFTTAMWKADPCQGTPTPGTTCKGGAIFLGTLGSDKYMTTPGRCQEIPAGAIGGGSGLSAWPSVDFTPTCTGASDTLKKYWHDGTTNYYDIPSLINYTTTTGTGQGAVNIDANYGSTNTANIVAITAPAQGGYHAAARYCDKLSYGGYTDWYLPNRYELNLMFINKTSLTLSLTSSSYYWSSTEYSSNTAWIQRFTDGNQTAIGKFNGHYVRCVRRY